LFAYLGAATDSALSDYRILKNCNGQKMRMKGPLFAYLGAATVDTSLHYWQRVLLAAHLVVEVQVLSRRVDLRKGARFNSMMPQLASLDLCKIWLEKSYWLGQFSRYRQLGFDKTNIMARSGVTVTQLLCFRCHTKMYRGTARGKMWAAFPS
jgi:hypothetical protein